MHTETDDLDRLIATLPPALETAARGLPADTLVELVLDLGRPPEARLTTEVRRLATEPVSDSDLAHVADAVGPFARDNRAGIEGTLHRIAAIRNRQGRIVGLTLRVGRAVFGTIEPIRDLVESGRSVLLLGRPGVGKTTRLREVARVLADDCGRRVIVIDTSNEIAGDGDIPHPAIGSARRMQVAAPDQQHAVMIEAVENHTPEVIVIDEIGTAAETEAARTIAERGVQLIGTAHGTALPNLIANPTLADLVGGVQTVTLGDDEARFRRSQKTVSERKREPTFDVVVEIADREQLVVHRDTGRAVDALLRGVAPHAAIRSDAPADPGNDAGPSAAAPPAARTPAAPPAPAADLGRPEPGGDRLVRLFAYAISRDSVEKVIRSLRLNARTVTNPEQADLVIALRGRSEDGRLARLLQETGAPLHTVKRNSTAQIRRALRDVFNIVPGLDDAEVSAAAREAEQAVEQVHSEGRAVELAARPAPIRQMQHRIAMRHHLLAESTGSEPDRHLLIQPPE